MALSNIWKEYSFRFRDEQECEEWIKALKIRKLEAVRENLNHAKVNPNVNTINKLAAKKLKAKLQQASRSLDNLSASETYNPMTMYTTPEN